MDFPYECTEQIFSRYFAKSLASHIANADPKIRQVFEQWTIDALQGDKSALSSRREQNPESKSLLLEQVPWVMDAKSETERMQRLGLLFDLNRLAQEQQKRKICSQTGNFIIINPILIPFPYF